MKYLFKSLISMLLLFLVVQINYAAFEDQDFTKIDLETIQVSEHIYMLQGVGGFAGGNLAVSVGKDGILMVDDQLAPMNKKINQKLKELDDTKLKFILNTHWHGDHTGGNALFGEDATIIAHNNVRNRMSTDQSGYFGITPASPRAALPVITFDESLSIHFNDEEIKLIHYPHGHTDGDGVVYFVESNVVHMGDLLFTNVFPFVDLDSGGNVFNYAENLQEILDWLPKDAKVIPGHGELTDAKGIKNTYEMLFETSNHVLEKVNKGMALSEIQAEGLPEKWESWGAGFINEETWISFIFKSLDEKNIY